MIKNILKTKRIYFLIFKIKKIIIQLKMIRNKFHQEAIYF